MKHLQLFIITLICSAISAVASDTTHIYRIDIHKDISSTTWRYLQAGIDEAQQNNAQAIILHLNTYGGTVLHADSMRTLLLNTHIPTYAYIENNAASAGALNHWTSSEKC